MEVLWLLSHGRHMLYCSKWRVLTDLKQYNGLVRIGGKPFHFQHAFRRFCKKWRCRTLIGCSSVLNTVNRSFSPTYRSPIPRNLILTSHHLQAWDLTCGSFSSMHFDFEGMKQLQIWSEINLSIGGMEELYPTRATDYPRLSRLAIWWRRHMAAIA